MSHIEAPEPSGNATGIQSVGVDWVTATMPFEQVGYITWHTSIVDALIMMREEGHTQVDTTVLEYVGLRCGPLTFVENEERGMVRVTSSDANRLWPWVHSPLCHVSRLDLQVTYRFGTPHNDIAQQIYNTAQQSSEGGRGAAARVYKLVTDSRGGSTCYVGSRTSAAYGRVYNKHAESGDAAYERCWRYEVELHNDSATRIATQLPYHPDRRAAEISRFVWEWFAKRGVALPWERDTSSTLVLDSTRALPSDEVSLQWLERQVAPTVRRLQDRGLRDRVLAALGLEAAQAEQNKRSKG